MTDYTLILNDETQFTDALTFQKLLLTNCESTSEIIELLQQCANHLLEAHGITASNVMRKNYGEYAEPAYMLTLFNAALSLTALTALETTN